MTEWTKSAFLKLARLGAIVFLPTSDGQFLFQEETKGLRPPGGGKETKDKTLTQTIIREIGEEFGIPAEKVKKKVRFLGYEYRKPFFGNAVFELRGHGLKPGLYQASNSPDEKVKLVKAPLDDPRYIGPQPEKLITEAARDIGLRMMKDAKAGRPTMEFPMANYAQFPAEDKEAMQNVWLDIEDELHGRRIPRPKNPKTNPPAGKKKMLKEGDVDSMFGQEQPWMDGKDHVKCQAVKIASAKTIGVDLDGTLAHHDSSKPFDPEHVGEPIDKMLEQVRQWIKEGKKVIIFTARASNPKNIPAVEAWLKKHGLEGLKVTHEKTPDISIFVDDKAVGVEKNTGEVDDAALDRLEVKKARFFREDELLHWAEHNSPPSEDRLDEARRRKEAGEPEETWREVCSCGKTLANCKCDGPRKTYVVQEGCRECSEKKWKHMNELQRQRRDPDGAATKKAGYESEEEEDGSPMEPRTYDREAQLAKVPEDVRAWIENYPGIDRNNSFHPANILMPREWEGFQRRHLQNEKRAKFHRPENWDRVKELSTKDFDIYLGCNDWENLDSWAWVEFHSPKKRVYLEFEIPSEVLDDEHGKWNGAFGKAVVRRWLRLAKEHLSQAKKEMDYEHVSLDPGDFVAAADEMKDVVRQCGLERQIWQEQPIKEASARLSDENNPVLPPSAAVSAPATTESPETTSEAPSPLEPPKTGPDAIYWALRNLDLNAKEAEAHDILKRKLKSKRDGAVKVLGIIDGLRRTGIRPHDLMITKVPVIPPQFRPFTVAGDTFIPGDANELYRDLINMREVNAQIGQKFGPKVQQQHALKVYDAMKGLYGFGEPTSPKTLERGVSGFLQKVSGSNPKWSFLIRKMTSKSMDYVGRSVVAVEPSYDMNTIGIPDEMSWSMYAPYIQRRLVRGGMKMEEAVRHVRDRSEHADKALTEEMKERPVIYSRSPAWHRFNIVAGWPKRVGGNAIMVNPFVTSGMGMDFDGDTVNAHTPAFPESVEDAKNKLMPDKMLFSIKKRNSVVPTIKQESLLGLWSAQHRPAKNVHKFSSQAEALQAIHAGKVPLSDEVEF